MSNNTKFDTNCYSHIRNISTLLGLLAYAISLYLIHKSERYHNGFGILCTAYVSFHIQTVILKPFPWTTFIRIFFPIANSTLYAAIWIQFVLAINRLWTISYPMTCHRIFSQKNARLAVVFLWSFSMLIMVLYYNDLTKKMNYVIIFIYFAMLLSDGVNLTTVSVNAIAFYCIVAYIKEVNATRESLSHDILFFKETCITTGIHAFLIAIFRIDEPFIARVTKVTYMWLAMSTLDSFTFIFSNRKLLRNRNVVNVCTTANNLVNIVPTKKTIN
uniref:7TM GPCR serpentine receptor class x (Srx) domain-containing protein n=1 Tax=Wuchereria bancrofti TaxID=6293 RepID=A0AAF5PK46_WUCBA